MSTAGDIITQAFREGNFTAVSETPTVEEVAEALPRLRSLLNTLFGRELGEKYRDWYVPSDLSTMIPLRYPLAPASNPTVSASDAWKYAPANVNLLVKTTEARTVYLPANPSDGARIRVTNIGSSGGLSLTLDGNGHLIDAATSLTATLTTLSGNWWLYRADLGSWVKYVDIVDGTTAMPLPVECDDYFVCGLAIRLAPRFQTEMNPETVARFKDMSSYIKQRYKQTENMPASDGVFNTVSEL